MKTYSIIFAFSLLVWHTQTFAQETIALDSFDKVVTGQHIALILEKGDRESITLEYNGIEKEKVNVKVKRGKLMVFLDKAKYITKREKEWEGNWDTNRAIYEGKLVTARVTYRNLRLISAKGEQTVSSLNPIASEKLTVKLYGGVNMDLAVEQAEKLRVKLYGNNEVRIGGGKVATQKLLSYGENKIDAGTLKSTTIKAVSYGENDFKVNASKRVKVSALGESKFSVGGNANLNKWVVIGENQFYQDKL